MRQAVKLAWRWPRALRRWPAVPRSDAAKALNPDPPSKMFADADALMSRGKFEDAAKKFEDVDREHPYSPEARRAIVMAAYAYYKGGKLPEAVASAERYTTMHPGTKEAPLAHHIIASSYFEQMQGANRDQDATRKALKELKTLKTRYPDSTYARQADNRIRTVRGHARRAGDGGRPLLRQDATTTWLRSTATRRWCPTTRRRPTSRRRSTGSLPPTCRSASRRRRRVRPPFWGTTSPTRAGTRTPTRSLQKYGLSPSHDSNSWVAKVWKGPARAAAARSPACRSAGGTGAGALLGAHDAFGSAAAVDAWRPVHLSDRESRRWCRSSAGVPNTRERRGARGFP